MPSNRQGQMPKLTNLRPGWRQCQCNHNNCDWDCRHKWQTTPTILCTSQLWARHQVSITIRSKDSTRRMRRPFAGIQAPSAAPKSGYSFESTKRRRLGHKQLGREQWTANPTNQNQNQPSRQSCDGDGRSGGGRDNNGGCFNFNSMLTREGQGSWTGGDTHKNTLKAFDNLKYCPNFKCGYNVDHGGRQYTYHPPWDAKKHKAHIVEGTLMKAQHKTLADGSGACMAWLMANPISQAQWVIA